LINKADNVSKEFNDIIEVGTESKNKLRLAQLWFTSELDIDNCTDVGHMTVLQHVGIIQKKGSSIERLVGATKSGLESRSTQILELKKKQSREFSESKARRGRVREEPGVGTLKITKHKGVGITEDIARHTTGIQDRKQTSVMKMFNCHELAELALKILHGSRSTIEKG